MSRLPVHCQQHHSSSALRLNDAYAYNENIPQHVLGSHEGYTCSICHGTYSLCENDLGTFDSRGECNHIFCYECLSEFKSHQRPGTLKCPNFGIEAYDIIRNERWTTSPETIEMVMDDQSAFSDWAVGTMSDTGINNRHEERCICCSQYAHNFVMRTGTPHMRNFWPPSPYAYGESPYAYGDQVLDGSAIFPLVTRWSRILCTHRAHSHQKPYHCCITLFR